MTRGLVNKLLHRILSGIRDGRAGIPDGVYAAEIARRLLSTELAIEGGELIDDDSDEDDEL
jgi:hypothetical protein